MNTKSLLNFTKFNKYKDYSVVVFRLNSNVRKDFSSSVLNSHKKIFEKNKLKPTWNINKYFVLPEFNISNVLNPISNNVIYNDQHRFYCSQISKYDSSNPYFAEVVVNRELHKGGKTSCRHMEFNIKGSGLRYEAGDHLAIFPTNDERLVTKISKLVTGDLKTKFSSNYSQDDNLAAKCTIPNSCTACQALTFYLDIASPPSRKTLKELSKYATDECQAKQLLFLSSTSEEAKKYYHKEFTERYKTIVDILSEMKSIKIDIIKFCKILPKLKPKYYSISCSPNISPDIISITFDIVKNGLVSNWLLKKTPNDDENSFVPIFVRKSKFRIPDKTKKSIVMICSGTGYAPFRSFIQERYFQFINENKLGRTILFLGGTSRHTDFIYEEEFKGYVRDGLLTLYTAFPKDDCTEVSDLLQMYSKEIWDVIYNCGHIYVCGSANLGKMANANLLKIIQKNAHSTTATAKSYLRKLEAEGKYQMEVA